MRRAIYLTMDRTINDFCLRIFRIYNKSRINNILMAPIDRDVGSIFLTSSWCNGQDLKCVVCIGMYVILYHAERKDHRPLVF